jgi:hypothetical protein
MYVYMMGEYVESAYAHTHKDTHVHTHTHTPIRRYIHTYMDIYITSYTYILYVHIEIAVLGRPM